MESHERATTLDKLKILLVNDHAPSLLALQVLLAASGEETGYSIVTADSGEQALRQVLQQQFAVILLDISMPGMDGFETAEIIHSHPRSASTPIIFITAHYADEMNRMKGYELGAVDYLITPVIPKVLQSKIGIFVELAKKNLQLELKTEELAEINKNLQVRQMRELKRNNDALEAEILVRRKAEKLAHELAIKDPLTGLFNRRSLIDRLDEAIIRAKRSAEPLALLFLDMDRFKVVNDTLGHDIGDELLIMMAARINSSVRETDLVARLGGDEFVVLMQGMSCFVDAATVAQKITHTTSPPFLLGAHSIKTSVSIGISLFPQDGDNGQALMRNADLAMYHAKQERRGSMQFFHEDFNAPMQLRMRLEQELQHALDRDEFELYYQPKIEFSSGLLAGVEALLRWHHPQMGLISAEHFIPIATECGLIVSIGEWVIAAACAQARLWQDAGEEFANVPIAVNIAIPQLYANLAHTIHEALARFDVPAQMLQLEITESLLIRDLHRATHVLQEISDSGISIAIDDFGTGYSSLSVLKALPINVLKIDQSFIRDLGDTLNDHAIVRAIVNMAHALGLKVVAEGVETEKQLSVLAKLGCDELQGFLFSQALPAHDLVHTARASDRIALPRSRHTRNTAWI